MDFYFFYFFWLQIVGMLECKLLSFFFIVYFPSFGYCFPAELRLWYAVTSPLGGGGYGLRT